MTWAALIQMLFTLFGPLIQKWLERLFDPAKLANVSFPVSTGQAVGMYFEAARSQLSWWQFGKHARLNLLERIAERHTPRIAQAMRFGDAAPMLTAEDLDELAGSI